MPNIKSAKKRMITSEKSRQSNIATKSRVSTERGKLLQAIEAGDKTESNKLFRVYCSVLDKAVKKGVIKANAADRRKSRIARKITAIA